jgi:SAM-dependent methyltransferase
MAADHTGEGDDWLAANRANWDDRTPIHLESAFYDVEGWLAAGTRSHPWEADALGDVTGLRLVHLQCHFGKDTLDWARAGALVTGLDFSPAAITAARHLADRAGLADRARFVCADVLHAAEALDHETFDVVYVSLGALCWLPSVRRWAEQVGELIAPGGRLFLFEGHPLAWALTEDGEHLGFTYFEEAAPHVDDEGSTYTDGDQFLTNRRNYQWNHSLGEIVTALTDQGLALRSLVEHDWTGYRQFPWLVEEGADRWATPPGRPRIPLSFTLQAGRPPA